MTHPCRVLLAFVTLAALVLAPRAWHPTTIIATATSPVGPKAYYLALGDSLAYGDQPNGQYFNGYADDLYASFALSGASHLIDMGCPHEMTTTFINGGCPYASAVKYPFTGSQLSAALTLISQHPGQVSPVTLDIGTDEIRPLFNSSTCALASTQTISQALSTFDSNLNTILSQLHTALNGAGDLLIMDNYFAHQNDCPNVVPLVQQFNAGLAAAAQQNGAIVAPVFAAFGGAATPNPNLCTLTWICAPEKDIHPNNQGYALIASTLDAAAGYPPLPPSPPPGEAASGVYEGTISTVGATSSYSITPSSSGSARVGMCANTNANNYDLYVYNSSGSLLASGTSPTNCEWASLSVTAGQAYTVTTVSVSGTGDFRSSWNVNGAQVVWNVGGAISSAGGTQDATFLTLSGAPIALSSCGPAGSNFNLELISAGGSVLASSTAPSNCQALTYTPSGQSLFRLRELDVHGGGSWLGTITTEMSGSTGGTPTPTATPAPGGPQSGTYAGSIASSGGSDSYTFTPGSSGPAMVGTCAVQTSNDFSLSVYDHTGALIGSGTAASYCNWATISVSAGQSYKVTTRAVTGSQAYRSSWSVNGAAVTWHVSRSITTSGGSDAFSFLTLGSGQIAMASCGPAGTIYDLNLTNPGTTVLASSSAPSNCQSLTYTPSAPGLFRLREVSVSGSGPYTATITTS